MGESLTQQFERFNSLVNELRSVGRRYNVEDMINKFMRSLPKEWKHITVIIRKTSKLSEYTLSRLYGELRVYELEVEHEMKLNYGAGGPSASPHGSAAFVAPYTGASQNAVHTEHGYTSSHEETQHACAAEDLDCVHEFDLEEEELLSQMAFLTMRVRKFNKKTGRNLGGRQSNVKKAYSNIDKTKVVCFKCQKVGHYASECRSKPISTVKPQSTGSYRAGSTSNQSTGNSHKSMVVEEYDWSLLSDDVDSLALMAIDSEVQTSSLICQNETCLKTQTDLKEELKAALRIVNCLKAEIQNVQPKINAEVQKSAKLINEAKNYVEEISVLKCENIRIIGLLTKAREDIVSYKDQIANWTESSNKFQKMLESQVKNNEKFGIGYNHTSQPTDYSIKNKEEVVEVTLSKTENKTDEKPQVKILQRPKPGDYDFVTVEDCNTDSDSEVTASKSVVFPIKKFVQGKTEHGSSSGVKSVDKGKSVEKSQTKKVSEKQKQKIKAKVEILKNQRKQKEINTCSEKKKSKNEFLFEDSDGCYEKQVMDLGNFYSKPFVPKIRHCFICGQSNHLSYDCFYNPMILFHQTDFFRRNNGYNDFSKPAFQRRKNRKKNKSQPKRKGVKGKPSARYPKGTAASVRQPEVTSTSARYPPQDTEPKARYLQVTEPRNGVFKGKPLTLGQSKPKQVWIVKGKLT